MKKSKVIEHDERLRELIAKELKLDRQNEFHEAVLEAVWFFAFKGYAESEPIFEKFKGETVNGNPLFCGWCGMAHYNPKHEKEVARYRKKVLSRPI